MQIYPNLSGNQTEALKKLTDLFFSAFIANLEQYFVFHKNFKSFFASKDSFTKYDYFYILAILSYFNNKVVYPSYYRNFPVFTVDFGKSLPEEHQIFVKTYDYFLNNSDYSNFNAKEFLLTLYTQEELDSIFESYYLIVNNINFNYEIFEFDSLNSFNEFKNTISSFLSNFILIKKSLLVSVEKNNKTFLTQFTEEIADNFIDSSIQVDSSLLKKNAVFDTSPCFFFVSDCFNPEAQNQLPSRINSIVISSFCSGIKTSSFNLKSVTKNQFFNNKGIFAFFTYIEKCHFSNENFNFLFLANTNSAESIKKYKKTKLNIKKFYNYLTKYKSLYFIDQEAYKEKVKESLTVYNKYSSNWGEYLLLNDHVDEEYVDSLVFKNNSENSFNIKSANAFFSSFNIDNESNQLIKSKKNFTKLLKDQIETFSKKNAIVKKAVSDMHDVLNTKINIIKYELYCARISEQLISTSETYPKSTSENRKAKEDFLSNIANTYISLFSERNNYLNSINYKTAELKENNLFTNLNNTYGIEIYSITYNVDSKDFIIQASDEEDSLSDISSMLVAKQMNPTFYFKSIKFATNNPVKILPDGNESKAIAAGPYVIVISQITPGNSIDLALKLKDTASIFGIKGLNCILHPHAGVTSIDRIYTHTARGCLGESTSYLFNSFKNNDLVSIIVNTLVWIKSANTTDTWGKNYKYFPKWSDLIINSQKDKEESSPVDLKDVILKSITSEECVPDSDSDADSSIAESIYRPQETVFEEILNSLQRHETATEPVYRPQEPVFLQEQPAARPVSGITALQATTSIEPESPLQSIRAETTSPVNTYTPYVRT